MASTPVEASQSADVSKKSTRLNPARRKAAGNAKTKAETEIQTIQVEALTASQRNPSQTQPQQPAKDAIQQLSSNAASKPSKPIKTQHALQRQQTSPALSKPAASQHQQVSQVIPKPNLTRSTTAPPSSSEKKGNLALTAPALVTGGLVGCAAGAAILLGVGLWYDFAGAESAILTAKAAKLCMDNLADEIIASLKAGTYSTDEALDVLRRTTLAYASTIPEGALFVERVFREINMVRKQRGNEVEKVVAETYGELQQAGKRGATSNEMRQIVIRQLTKLSTFAGRATRDVVTRNPNLTSYKEGAVKALEGPPPSNVPTIRVNMAIRQKQSAGR